MPLFFDVDEEKLTFQLRIMFDHEHDEQSMAEWLKDLLKTLSHLQKDYKSFLDEGDKLTSQQRAVLVESVDKILTDLCMFQKKMKDNMKENNIVSLKHDWKVMVVAAPNNFTSHGKLSKEDLYGIETFINSFKKRVLAKTKDFLKNYRKIVNAKINNTLEDFELVLSNIDDILFSLLIMRFSVNNYLVER